MNRMVISAVAMAVFFGPTPAMAQMDWLSPHLENQRHDNIRRHQQRTVAKRSADTAQSRQTPARITMAQRQSAWSRHKAEYRRRLLREGQAGADRWLDQQILAGL